MGMGMGFWLKDRPTSMYQQLFFLHHDRICTEGSDEEHIEENMDTYAAEVPNSNFWQR